MYRGGVTRRYRLGKKTRVRFSGGIIEKSAVFAADMYSMQLECKSNLDQPKDWVSPLMLTFMPGRTDDLGEISPWDFYKKECG